MTSDQQSVFSESIDIVQLISEPAREHLGEDCFYCVNGSKSAIVSVFDGCGGLGARTYASFQGHTGAYIASRIVSGAVHDWYHTHSAKSWKSSNTLAVSIRDFIRQAYKVCEVYAVERLKVKGTMVRKLPTTMALAYAECGNDEILLHVLWAGDSRVYLLDSSGLAQLSKDDTDVEDALENLMCDSPMTNVISADGQYEIRHRTIHLNEPSIIFASTDGCFGYIPSPMEFEYMILESLINGENPQSSRENLRRELVHYAGDDLTLGMMSFYYGDFNNMKKLLWDRFQYLKKEYLQEIEKDDSFACRKNLWENYQPVYERYLR